MRQAPPFAVSFSALLCRVLPCHLNIFHLFREFDPASICGDLLSKGSLHSSHRAHFALRVMHVPAPVCCCVVGCCGFCQPQLPLATSSEVLTYIQQAMKNGRAKRERGRKTKKERETRGYEELNERRDCSSSRPQVRSGSEMAGVISRWEEL